MADLSRVLSIYERYIDGRNALLEELNLGASNRDPLSEFSEWLVAALVGGTRAESRVQKGWDVRTPSDEKIQVKYLANPPGQWINPHTIEVTALMDSYAIVFFEALLPQAIIIFPTHNLVEIGNALSKKHGKLDTTLQLTYVNYRQILNNADWFKKLGVRQYLPPDWKLR